MKILVVVAVLAVFGALRFRRANLLMWALAWWAGIYVLLRFGFTAPIPASVVAIYMGIVSLAILAYVSSSQERREDVSRPLIRFMTEKRYTALLGLTVVAIPALAAANDPVASRAYRTRETGAIVPPTPASTPAAIRRGTWAERRSSR